MRTIYGFLANVKNGQSMDLKNIVKEQDLKHKGFKKIYVSAYYDSSTAYYYIYASDYKKFKKELKETYNDKNQYVIIKKVGQ